MRATTPTSGEAELQGSTKEPIELLIAIQAMTAALRHMENEEPERARDVLTQGLGMILRK